MTSADIKLVRKRTHDIIYRPPSSEDGADVWRLIQSCEPLDENSLYCNLLQCDHFGDTCVAAERADDGALVGWVSGYLLPDEPETLFVWQVAVDSSVQGMGVGKKLLAALLERDACENVRTLKTTITSDNKASWGLFSSLARVRDGELDHEPYFRKDAHFDGKHATEHMVTIAFAGRTPADVRQRWFPALDAGPARSDDAA
ncbi:diaminobutyrate acetyltransferase [Nitratireductor pacificus]|uniref:L-2,4-diaminobutyric acid acetyltransferase n=1 Tax=Nitratireductor pacificus pht-3B TaxID=391937 RepID=K2M9L3_9HYPH|nr:diaminobutyrate acetyltransferase [Nitratireductor pacificus]EKF18826.1 L-2,4-diaminobutyric acid acetyltransferase [Nitratireductor pacificus pht-3B]